MSRWPRWFGGVLVLSTIACDTPSSRVDGDELHGVFERDAAADGSASVATATAVRPKRDAGRRPSLPELRRPPVAGPCAKPPLQAPPKATSKPRRFRPAGRPACRASRVLEWKDPAGNPRYACLISPRRAAQDLPLPLLLYFHRKHDTPRAVDQKTRLRRRASTTDLTGDPKHQGYRILSVQARRIDGKLQFDPSEVSLRNVDVQTVDHFVDVLEQEGLVDRRRIYAVGDGSGGPMATLYSYLRPERVAAMALYASEASAIAWSCAAAPPPAMILYRACDTVMPCPDVERWVEARRDSGATTVGLRLGAAKATEPNCVPSKQCKRKRGETNHARWPKGREEELLEFLARFSLEREP